jgi:hypothetical protein
MLYGYADGFLEAGAGRTRRQNDRTGIGDLYLSPLRLNWRSEEHHVTISQGIFAPTGSYDPDRLINLGRNHWGFNTNVSYTWLNEKRGHEISLTAGYLVNTKNTDTDYRSGNEFHLDYLLAHHFSPRVGLGFTGYWYKQVTGDHAGLLRRLGLGSFRGKALGIGLAVLFKPTIGGKDTNFVLKWVHDVHARRRFEGSEIMLSVGVQLWPWSPGKSTSVGATSTTQK